MSLKGSASPWPGVKCLGRILAAPERKLAQAPKVPRERTRWLHRDSSARSTPADTEELSLYLAVTMKRGELEELGLGDVTHTRLKKGGASPGITTKEVISRQPSTKSLFRIQAFQSGHCGAPLP